MPFRVVNRSPRRTSPQKSFSVPCVHERLGQISDEVSIYSDASSDNGTLHTVYSDVSNKKGIPPGYVQDKGYQEYPQYLGDEKRRSSDEYDPYAEQDLQQASTSSSHGSRSLSGTVQQLASAVGPDNVFQTTEIDTIPCAGVRIPHGPLKGLLAWRLVVRIPERAKFEDWWKESHDQVIHETRRRVHSMRLLSRPPAKPNPSAPHSFHGHIDNSVGRDGRRSFPSIQDTFAPPQPEKKPIILVSNFILDTSIPHSVISRDALGALGYPLPRFPKDPRIDDSTVMLSIQGVRTRLCIANRGEASRLGVQFLHDAGVSVFFPQNGDGIGPVLYRMWLWFTPSFPRVNHFPPAVESAQVLKNVPSTLPGLEARERKNTLRRRVGALLGLSA